VHSSALVSIAKPHRSFPTKGIPIYGTNKNVKLILIKINQIVEKEVILKLHIKKTPM
jgi:hypothetical protein